MTATYSGRVEGDPETFASLNKRRTDIAGEPRGRVNDGAIAIEFGVPVQM